MKVQVLYFGELRETVGVASEVVALDLPAATVTALLHALMSRGEPWGDALSSSEPLRVAVDQEMATLRTELSDGAEVALFRPVTGG
jgi:molybdopterin converting factor subunit 1